MKKTHVENNDVQLLARMGRVGVNADKKMLRASKNAVIGIKTWGKIDYLVNHRGWSMVRD
jgi:hypothetical protein